jgi:hypothetical protein
MHKLSKTFQVHHSRSDLSTLSNVPNRGIYDYVLLSTLYHRIGHQLQARQAFQHLINIEENMPDDTKNRKKLAEHYADVATPYRMAPRGSAQNGSK